MKNQAFRDPAEKHADSWRVIFNDEIMSPSFNCRGAAEAYLGMLERGARRPEVRTPGRRRA